MPGLIDLHYHTAIGKGCSDHLPLWEYLETCWYPLIRGLDADSAYWAARGELPGVDQVRRDHGQRHVPAAARPGAGRRPTSGSGRCCPTTSPLDEHNLDTLQDNKDAYDAVHGIAGGRIEVLRRDRVAPAGLPGAAARRPGPGRRARHRHPRPPQRVADRGGELQGAVRPPADRGGLRRGAARAGLRGRPLRLAVGHRDRPDARDRHPDLATTRPPTPSSATASPGCRRCWPPGINVGLGHDAAECNNSLRHVRGDEVRVADPPGRPGRREPAAGAGRAGHGHPQRGRAPWATTPASSARAARPT